MFFHAESGMSFTRTAHLSLATLKGLRSHTRGEWLLSLAGEVEIRLF